MAPVLFGKLAQTPSPRPSPDPELSMYPRHLPIQPNLDSTSLPIATQWPLATFDPFECITMLHMYKSGKLHHHPNWQLSPHPFQCLGLR